MVSEYKWHMPPHYLTLRKALGMMLEMTQGWKKLSKADRRDVIVCMESFFKNNAGVYRDEENRMFGIDNRKRDLQERLLLTLEEAASYLNIRRTQLDKLIAQKQIVSIRIDGSPMRRVTRQSLEQWVSRKVDEELAAFERQESPHGAEHGTNLQLVNT